MGGRLGGCKSRDAQRSCGREEHSNPPRLRKGFLERLKFLRYQLGKERSQPCGIAARRRETCDVSNADRVAMGAKYDRHGFGRRQKDRCLCRRGGKQDIDLRPDQLGCQLRQLIGSLPPTEAEGQVLSFGGSSASVRRPSAAASPRFRRFPSFTP